ncbi:ESPR-type extended signal peptide-containing protein [Megasphaera sp. DJF_B143]|uniref:ESPR-type extended signal peptide-containing protein n=2 Tax=unclassified Megasphaera TaxID=2626256 RepID=UPI00073EDAA6|nr:ESPR-type extended signal peptide-containing protein [Megasphaera sp. DJF_B143]KUH57409.1 hypothetical protein AT798_00400 [Megasphaera sp. DJF_B143]
MNKIYKVIWSKVRNCYIVVSELAKSHDSAHGTRSRSECARKAAVLAAFVLTTSLLVAPDWAQAATATNSGNPSANQAVNIENKNNTTAQGSDAYATYDSQGNLIVGKDNQISPIQKDPKTGNARVDKQAENVALGTRNGVGKFTHSTETKKPISGDESYAYQKLDTEWITVKVYNPNTGSYDDKQMEVYKLTPGQYMDDEYNVRAKVPTLADYNYNQEAYNQALNVYNSVANYLNDDRTRKSYYVSGSTAVGVDNVAEGDHSTAIGNKAKVLNSVGSYYVDAYGRLTREQNDAYYYLDEQGRITTTPQYVKDSNGQYVRDTTGNYIKTSFLTVDRLIDSTDAVAVGSDVTAEGRSAVAIGHESYAKEYSVAIGENSVTDYMGVAIGKDNMAKYASTAIGHTNDANGYYTATLGVNNTARADESTAIGYGNSVDGQQQNGGTTPKATYTHVLGSNNTVKGSYNAVFGDTNKVTGAYALALGGHNTISGANTNDGDGEYGIAIGYGNTVEKNALALGLNSNSIHDGSIAIGKSVNTTGDNNNGATDSIAIGTKSTVHMKNGIVLGNEAYAGNNGDNSEGAIAIGHQARSAAGESIAIGTQATTGNNVGSTGMRNIGAIAIGSNSNADTVYDIAMGVGASTTNTVNGGAIALGHNATIEQGGQASAAIGNSARVKMNLHDAVALGSQAYADREANNQGGYDPASNNKNHNAGSDPVWNSTLAAVSVGSSEQYVWDGSKNVHYAQQTRQITNVAAGKEDTDAVNVAQLKQVVNLVNNSGGGSGTGGSGVHDYSVKSVTPGTDTNYNNGGASGDNALAAGVSASATGENAVAIGTGATAKGKGATVIGQYAKANGDYATAFGGSNTDTTGEAVGNTADGANSVAFGERTSASGPNSTAFGWLTTATEKRATAFGERTTASGANSTAFGQLATASGQNSTAFGNEAVANNYGSTAFGNRTEALGEYSTAFGNSTVAAGMNTVAFGTDNVAGAVLDDNGAYTNIIYKTNAKGRVVKDGNGNPIELSREKMDARGNLAYLDGSGNTKSVTYTVSGGETHSYVLLQGEDGNTYIRDYRGNIRSATIGSDGKVTVGDKELTNVTLKKANAGANGYHILSNANATVWGENSIASGEASTAFGVGSTASGKNSLAVGGATASLDDSIALGKGSVTTRAKYSALTKDEEKAAYAKGASTGSAWEATDNAIAVGNDSKVTRQITGVAAGALDTDAVNVAQLKAVDAKHTTVSVGGTHATADNTAVKGGNLELTRTTNGQANYDVALSKDVVLGEQEEHKGGSLVVNSVAQFRKAPGSKETYPVKEAVKIDGTTVSVVKNDGTNDQRQVVLGVGQDTGGYVALFDNTGKTPTYIFNAISSGITYLKDGKEYPADEANEFNRLEYGDITNGSTQFIATLDDGLKFSGDKGTTSAVKLNQKLTVTGGETNPDNLATANNIGVVSSQDGGNGKLELKLNKDLTGLNTVTAGTAKIGHYADGVLPTVQNGQPTISYAKAGDYVTGLTNKDWTVNNPTYVSGRAATEDELRIVSDAVSGNTTKITNNTNQITNNTNTIAKGLSFTTNTKDDSNTSENYKGYKVVKRNLGDTIAIKASDETGGHDYSTANLTTRIAENGDISILMDEKPTFTTVTTGDVIYTGNPDKKDNNGKAAQADTSVHYGDKTLTDGKNITTSDNETKATRLGYKDAQDKRHDIATLDDGQIYAGDITSDGKLDENGFARTLNQKTTINGGVKETGKLTDGNIGVVSNGTDTLTVKLAKDLKDLTSVTTGKTVQNNSGITITNDANDETKNVVINGDKISFGGNQVTNMDSGINKVTNQYDITTNGANIGDVKNIANSTTEAAKLTGDSNITVTYNDAAARGKNTVKLNDSITLGSDADKKVTIDGTKGTITAGDKVSFDGRTGKGSIGGVTIGNQTGVTTTKKDGDKAKTEDGTFVTGLTNTTWNPDANGIVSGRAATEDQLKTVSDTVNAGWELDVNGTKQKAVTPTSPKVNFVQGQNITIFGSGDDVTVATADSVRFDTVRVTSDKNDSGSYTGGITIGKQSGNNPDGTVSDNPGPGYYITGLENKDWDSTKIQHGRAATEDQLQQVAEDIKQGTVTGDKYITGGTATYTDNGSGSAALSGTNGLAGTISGLHDYYIKEGTVSDDGKTLTLTKNDDSKVTVNLDKVMKSDMRLVQNPARTDGKYTVDSNGNLNLTVQDANGTEATRQTITLSGLASKAEVDKGLTFAANSGKPYNAKLGNTVTVKGSVVKDGHDYSDENLTTEVDANGNITIKLDKALTADTVMVNGKDGKDGQIGLNGKDGKNGTVTTIIRTIGKNGTDGKNGTAGVNGTDGITRIVYQDGKDGEPGTTTHTVATLDDGLKFGANAPVAGKTDNPVGNKLNSTINIKGAGTKTLDQYSGQNLITSVEQDADGNTTINVLMDKNISADGVTVGHAGKDGVAGADGEIGKAGTIGINGKDGKDGITTTIIRTEKGQPGKDGTNGKPGVDGTDITRIVYQNGQDGTDGKDIHAVATLEDGLKFAGDDGQKDDTKVISKKLNEQLDIIGGANPDSLTDNNIGVKNKDGKLYVRLAKHVDLGKDGSLKAGDLTIGAFSNTQLLTNKNNHAPEGSYATGLSNKDWSVADPEYVSGRAATEDQLKVVSDAIHNRQLVNTDYQLVANPDPTTDGSYTAADGELTLTVRDTEHKDNPKYPDKTITIKDIASKTKVDEAYDRTVKYDMKDGKVDKTHVTFEAKDADNNPVDTQVSHMASGASAITDDGKGNKTYTYNTENNAANIGDVKRLAAEADLHYSGDTGTGTSQLKDTVAFNGTKGQIVTEATNGKVTFKLADDLMTRTITVTGKDGKNGQPGTPGHIGIDGKDGQSGIGIDGKDGISIKGENGTIGLSGKDGISVKGKDGKDGVTITGKDGVDGVNGAEGHIGLNGKDGMVDIWTKPGKPGVDGKDGETMTRIVYKNPDGQEHQGATLDDGLKFHGDSGDVVTRKLNTQLDVLGGQTDTAKLTATTDGNIGVVSTKAANEQSNGKMEIRLAKELKGLTSVQTGDTTVEGNGLTINKAGNGGKDSITINKTTVSIAGNQITNMGSGIDGTKYTDAGDNNGANIGDVKKLADSRKTTVKSTDGSVKVTNTSTDSNHFDYDLSVDTTKVAGAVDLKYKGDNNTEGSNKLSEAVTFSGTEGQIVTQAEDGKVTFKLADDLTTQTITATGKNGNDGQIGLTGKDGADGKVTTIIKTVGAKGTDGKDGIPGVDGQPGKDGITRLVYDETDDKGGTEHHVVATLDDGLKFVGNDGNVVTRKLNDTLSIKGGIDDPEVLADKSRVSRRNLGVRQNTAGDGLEIVMTNRPDFEAITVGPDSNPAHKITIGQQNNKDGNPNPTKGNYITGLDNTQWDAGNVVADRAATEGQLSQAITDISGKEKGGFGLADEKGGTVKKELGGTIAVKGDGTNIETKVKGDALEVSLKKDVDLGQDGSIKAGETTIDEDGVKTNEVKVGDITITQDGIDGGAKQITNIASGLDSTKHYADPVDNNAASIGDVKQIAGDEASKAADAVKSKSGKNITVKDDHTVNLNDHITLGDDQDKTKQVAIDGNGAKVTAGDGANKVTVDGSKGQVTIGSGDKTLTLGQQANTAGDSNPAEGNYLNGLDNTKWDGEHIQSGRAATEDQLKTVSDKVNSGRVFQGDDGKEVKVGMGDTLKIQGGVKAEDVSKENNIGIVKGADDTLNIRLAKDLKGLDSVTTGNTTIDNGGLTVKTGDSSHQDITIKQGNVNMGGNKIEGVAPGAVAPDSTDAVNGSQLYAAGQAISNLGGAVNKLGTRVDRVGAGSAALAALHPLDFDPDDKWDFAAGYGHYRGANAAAVGAYYRPNEDTMFSIGGSFGGGENMFNAGVSIKLGQGNHISTSRVAMAKEIKDLRENVAQLNQIVNRQSALIEKLTSVDTGSIQDKGNDLFPDVPENHWAYEYVSKLAKAGILKGYPDGNFAGDRMMTRYEFAAIVYRAITMGAASDPSLNQDGTLGKLAKEFNQELKFIRIDTIHHDAQGEPTVQRVRVQDTTK